MNTYYRKHTEGDLLIKQTDRGDFICEYPKNPHVVKAVAAEEAADGKLTPVGSVAFTLSDGRVIKHRLPKYSDELVYLGQYGIDVSEDASCYFLHSWYSRGGLSCFDLNTGGLRWQVNIKHARGAFITGEHILCFFLGYGIVKVRISTGEIVGRYPMSMNDDDFYRLSDDLFMVGLKQRNYRIINSALEEVYRIPQAVVNPRNCLSFLLQSCTLESEKLKLKGIENCPDPSYGADSEHRFVRTIDLGNFKLKAN